MNDVVAEIFGYIILVIAVALLGWETYTFKRRDEEFSWLQTPRRFKRRAIMAGLLVCVGFLIIGEVRGYLALDNARYLLIYIGSLTALAFLLLILSVRDLGDMARSAEKQAIDDLKKAIEDQQKAAEQVTETSE